MILVAFDEWHISDKGFSHSRRGSAKRFVLNLAELFSPGRPGNFLIYSANGAFGQAFRDVLTAAGHRVTSTMTPQSLHPYDGVFVSEESAVDQRMLADYVDKGGKLYIAGVVGLGQGDPPWNVFLQRYGLRRVHGPSPSPLVADGSDPSPLLKGVDSLYIQRSATSEVLPNAPFSRVFWNQYGRFWFGLYDAPAGARQKPAAP